MFRLIMLTERDHAATIARLALALMILPHGAQKLLGWFGGPGFGGTVGYFSDALGLPAAVTTLVIVGEFFGGLALLVGLLGRVAAGVVAGIMVGAVLIVHLANGWFMNWSGTQAGEGYEFHLLAVALALIVTIKGSGALSLDRRLAVTGGAVEPAPRDGRAAA